MRQTDLLKRYISVGFMLLILVGCQSTSTSTPTSLPPTEPSVSQIFQRCNQSGHNTACYVSGDAGTIVVQGTKARFNTPGDTINLSGITSLILNSASDAVAIRVQPVGSPEAVQQDLAVILFGNVEMHDMALGVGKTSFDFKLRTTTSQLCLYTTYKYAGSSNRQSSLVNTSFASHRLQTSHAPPIIPISTLFPFQNRATQSPLLSPFLELTPTPRFSPRVVRTPLPFQNRATQSPLLSPFLELTPTPRFSPRVVHTPR